MHSEHNEDDQETAGGTRFNRGKPSDWWAIPLYGLKLVAKVTKAGSEKYAPRDWREGQSFSTLIDSMSRHYIEVMERGPWSRDPENGCYHIAQMVWNALCLLTFMALGRRDLDDVSPWYGVTTAEKREAEVFAEKEGIPLRKALEAIKTHFTEDVEERVEKNANEKGTKQANKSLPPHLEKAARAIRVFDLDKKPGLG